MPGAPGKPEPVMQKMFPKSLVQPIVAPGILLAAGLAAVNVSGQDVPAGDATRGQAYFKISCEVCHSPALGPDNTVIMKQGPSLVGVMGRAAGSSPHFNYTRAMRESGLTWDAATLNRFLANPMSVTPGTTMPMPVPDA